MFKQLRRIFSTREPAASEVAVPSMSARNSLLINAYCTRADVPKLKFPHHLNGQRNLSDPELIQHLSGFIGYVRSRGNGEMSRTRYHVLRHIQRTQQHLSFSIEDSQLDAVSEWAEGANALLFLPDGNVRDPHGRILVSADDGSADASAVVPYPVEAWERKARTDAFLDTQGLQVPLHLPPVVSETELRLRRPQEVAGRALALFLVAVRSESVATNEPISVAQLEEKFPVSLPHLTPVERAFLNTETPSATETTQFSWRYESLFLLEWALGLTASLPFPNTICDVPLTARTIASSNSEELFRSAKLRPANEILDALDLHYRLHWLVRQAQVEEKPVPAGLEGGVILERHYALNWLVCFEDSEWDDVDTPT